MAHLNLEIPDEPETNHVIRSIIGTFYLASRGRRYLGGMSILPLPITVKEITDVLEAHPVYIDRTRLDPCIFALDDAYLSDVRDKADSKSK